MLGFSAISSGPLSYSGESAPAGTAAGVTLTGAAIFVPGLAVGGSTAAGVVLTGIGTFVPGTATGGGSGSAPGVVWIGTSTWLPGLAAALIFARAPSGGGYSPRRNEASSRPAAIQRNNR